MKQYDSLAYARGRLIGTIVRAKDVPVRVIDINDDTYHCADLLNGGEINCPTKDIDITPVPLGYVNCNGTATYVTRIPKRRDWRQGLRNENVGIIGGGRFDRLNMKELAKAIMGKYPTFKQVIKALMNGKEKPNTLAFCREFCVDKNMKLWYRGGWNVGTIEEGKVKLLPDFEWVADSLAEVM